MRPAAVSAGSGTTGGTTGGTQAVLLTALLWLVALPDVILVLLLLNNCCLGDPTVLILSTRKTASQQLSVLDA
jgi:hypothetical protein